MQVSSFTYLAISVEDADDFDDDDDDDCQSLKLIFLGVKAITLSRRKQGLKEYR
jgi:hypothetical protein